VVSADYDVDGFLDLYVTNGLLYYPVGEGGPDTLLRNSGNNNHWLEIDLVGTTSNRDGVGAKVYVTAGGVTQLREQNGGYHRWSQNHQRIHVGLGSNTSADVTIEWPSGAVDNFTAIAADALYDAVEGGSMSTATLGPPIYTTLQAGDECGEPPYDLDYGPAVLLWKDCGTGVWSLRAKGGRVNTGLQYTAGQITADAPFSQVSGYNLSGGDAVNASDNDLDFSVGAWYSNNKGINFSVNGQTESCLNLTTQDIPVLIVGGSKKAISAPFDLVTLGACVEPPPPPEMGPECGDPEVQGPTDFGLHVWKDCEYAGTSARWNVTIGGGGSTWAGYAGLIASDVTLSATGSELEGNDILDTTPDDSEIDFTLFVGGSGVDAFQVDVPAGSETCFVPVFFFSGSTYSLGADRLPISGNFDMLTMESCEPPPPPPTDPACGVPDYDRLSEPGVFIWRDCNYIGSGNKWVVRAVAGGAAWGPYQGNLSSSSETLSASGFSLEGSDVLDSVPGDGVIDFVLKVGGSGQDGFSTIIMNEADACFDVTLLQGGAQVQLGEGRQIMGGAFNLDTLGACN
jgi:hypothetical protein